MAVFRNGSAKVSGLKENKSLLPYFLLAPGLIYLILFFVFPIISLGQMSTKTSSGEIGQYKQSFRFANYVDAFLQSKEQFGRSFIYAILATLLALAVSYPLAYAIAFKSGRWKNVLLVLIVAPFFTSFLLRTIAWKQILGEEGPVIKVLRGRLTCVHMCRIWCWTTTLTPQGRFGTSSARASSSPCGSPLPLPRTG